MQFIFAADPIESGKIDPFFLPQSKALGGQAAVFSVEESRASRVTNGETLVYRGWMLDANGYRTLQEKVEEKGAHLLTSFDQYLKAHYIPNWYPSLKEFTAETRVFENSQLESPGFDLVSELTILGWDKFFLKDFVKSLKTHGGSVTTAENAPDVVHLMRHFRGTLEGGLCVRRYESLENERRYFLLNGKFSAPNNQRVDISLLKEIRSRIDLPFISIDIADNEHGQPRLVEIGDGQVSDLVNGWTTEEFADLFRSSQGF